MSDFFMQPLLMYGPYQGALGGSVVALFDQLLLGLIMEHFNMKCSE